jgi:hypothetical protein
MSGSRQRHSGERFELNSVQLTVRRVYGSIMQQVHSLSCAHKKFGEELIAYFPFIRR